MQKYREAYSKNWIILLLVIFLQLSICYGFASLSIDRGNLFWYLLTIIFLVSALKDFIRLINKLKNVYKTTRTR